MTSRTTRAWAVAVGAVLTAVGCSPAAPALPEGWTKAEVERLDLHVPPGWDRAEGSGEWGDVWELEEDGQAVGQLAVATVLLDDSSSAELLGSGLLEGMQALRGSEMEVLEVLPDPMVRDGDFYRVRYTYDGGGQEFHGVIWALGKTDAQPVAVRLTTATSDDELVERIEDGLRFRP